MVGVGNNGVFLVGSGYGCAETGFIHCSAVASL